MRLKLLCENFMVAEVTGMPRFMYMLNIGALLILKFLSNSMNRFCYWILVVVAPIF